MNPSRILATVVALLGPVMAHAHFLWLTIDREHHKLTASFRERPMEDPLDLKDRAGAVHPWKPGIRLSPEGNLLKGDLGNSIIGGVSLDYGVIDRKQAGRGLFWLEYFAKGAVDVRAASSRIGLGVEITTEPTPAGLNLKVWKDGAAAPDAEVLVEEDGVQTVEARTDANGELAVKSDGGELAIRALVTIKSSGEHGGKVYDFVRRYSTLTISGEPLSVDGSLMSDLKESFGDSHEVVSHTSFIRTTLAGQLTKAQLNLHLRQRALIHEALEAIFARLNPDAVPFGEDQKRVSQLLLADIKALGGEWPTSGEATPLTRAFLRTLAEKSLNSPYFALGVFHIYYGGITHGGRDIGAKIGKTLGFTPTYYEKSDGYSRYARKLNRISDRGAREQVIEGANAAYRYIIEFNNLSDFGVK